MLSRAPIPCEIALINSSDKEYLGINIDFFVKLDVFFINPPFNKLIIKKFPLKSEIAQGE